MIRYLYWMKIAKTFLSLLVACAPIATAQTFESLGKTTSSMRLPASVMKEAIEFDCATPSKDVELSTQQETIRIIGKNCPKDISVLHTQFNQKLHSFAAADENTTTSEFAYLRKGDNIFDIRAGGKTIYLKVFRY